MRETKKAKVMEAAQSAFLRYGFRRVTMGDIASAAGISRPALYIHFCNKEKIFEAVLRTFTAKALDELREGLAIRATLEEQLRFAFEIWAVRPYALIATAPDARELIDCGFEFAREALDQGSLAFERELAGILTRHSAQSAAAQTPEQTARILSRAVHGFKQTATSAEDLRGMIDGLLAMVLASAEKAGGPP
jgi:AcrR family transcriptional regulator